MIRKTREIPLLCPYSPSSIFSIPTRCVHYIRSATCWIGLLVLVLAAGCNRAPQVSKSATSDDGWHEFEGTWTAAGSRHIMSLGGNRQVSVSLFNGSLMLTGPSRPEIGFRSKAIVFNDTATGMIGRAVWTNENGDEAYSELRGEGTAKNNKITGTFVGGTGPYVGATGTYEFSWRFVLENEDGVVQGQSMGLKGRVRIENQQARSVEGGRRS